MSSGSETRQRRGRVTIRFFDPEMENLKEKADRAGISVSSFARLTLLGITPDRTARRPQVEKTLLAKTLGELGKIGSNINQIARTANTRGAVERDDEEYLRRASLALEAMRDAVLSALGRRKAG